MKEKELSEAVGANMKEQSGGLGKRTVKIQETAVAGARTTATAGEHEL